MIRSMTGFGRVESVLEGRKYLAEIKALNHRNLEMSLRLSSSLQPLELEIRKMISERFTRGRIEATIRADMDGDRETIGNIELNLPLAHHYHALLSQLKEELHLKDEINLNMIVGLRDTFIYSGRQEDLSDLWQRVAPVIGEAIEAVVLMREREGEVLHRDLKARIDLIRGFLDSISLRAPQIVLDYQKRLKDRLKILAAGIAVDESRMIQEVAIMAEKSDITEEIVRLESHIGQLVDMMTADEAIGRKVDFLLQEMNREANTIASKSNDTEVSRNVIEIKSELAKLREQLQNVE
jgi:uncharacterized protein (TIGR00255 family)